MSAEDDMMRDGELQRAVEAAVSSADRVILDASDGSVEETDLLTAMVAEKFMEKVLIGARHKLLRQRLSRGETPEMKRMQAAWRNMPDHK